MRSATYKGRCIKKKLKNTILKCSDYRHKEIVLPEGYSIVSYRPGFEKDWARLEFSIGDFGSLEEAEQYFADTYLQNPEMFSRILFALDKDLFRSISTHNLGAGKQIFFISRWVSNCRKQTHSRTMRTSMIKL